jgi:hypothetical protein
VTYLPVAASTTTGNARPYCCPLGQYASSKFCSARPTYLVVKNPNTHGRGEKRGMIMMMVVKIDQQQKVNRAKQNKTFNNQKQPNTACKKIYINIAIQPTQNPPTIKTAPQKQHARSYVSVASVTTATWPVRGKKPPASQISRSPVVLPRRSRA